MVVVPHDSSMRTIHLLSVRARICKSEMTSGMDMTCLDSVLASASNKYETLS